MKPKRQDSRSSARNGAPPAPSAQPARSEAEELSEMWNAVAALLDHQTVGGRAQAAPPSGAAPATPPAAPPPATEPVAPPDASADGTGASWGAPWGPSRSPSVSQATAEDNAEGDAAKGPLRSHDGQESYGESPGVGPQLLPMPDAEMPTDTPPPGGNTPASVPSNAAGPLPVYTPPPAFEPRLPGSPYTLPNGIDFSQVTLRGLPDGVTIEIGDGPWNELMNLLSYRLEQSAGFFRNGHIAVATFARVLTEPELGTLRAIMTSYGMEPSLLRTYAERTFYAAVALGLPVTQIAPDGSTVLDVQRATAQGSAQGYYVYRGTLRTGQQFYRTEHILVIGDVNPGAEVISDGDVMVWGRLRGTAHAGARGNTQSIIAALDLDPVQLRIDTRIAAAQAGLSDKGPRWGSANAPARRPEIARLVDGKLVIEPWDEIRPTGTPILKRRKPA